MQAVNGTWVLWQERHGNKLRWHWTHGRDPVTYCGIPTRTEVVEAVAEWDPLNGCRKCLERINREGY